MNVDVWQIQYNIVKIKNKIKLKKNKKKREKLYITESLFYIPETNTIL